MKRIKYLSVIAIMTGLLVMNSCQESFLEITPNGSLDVSVLATYEGVDGLLIAAYSLLDGASNLGFGEGNWAGATSNWVYGSIRAMEANKGTDSGDQPHINPIQTFSETSTSLYINTKWQCCYEGVSRCNSTIVTARAAEDAGTITADEATSFIRQARALRGFYHLEAWRMWANRTTNTFVPYVDENTDQNTLVNTVDIRTNIIEDLTEGTLLPLNMSQVGRFNKTVSQVFLAKALMQMYGDYAAALTLLSEVEASGTNPAGQKAALEPLYGDIFDIEKRNCPESIYTVQYSVNDGSGGWNGGNPEVLNFPYKSGGSPGGCCGFFQPTQDFVNSFRTDANGLPFLDTYNSEKVTSDQGLPAWDETGTDPFVEYTGQLDPRLDWSVGRRGIPFWDWGPVTGTDWIRDQTYAGPYVGKKQVYKKEQEGVWTEVGNWTSGWTANGYRMIRFSDVLLLKAECEAMEGSDDRGMGEVNAIRTRASNTASWVKEDDGVTNAANYVIGTYTGAQFANQTDAMKAIKFERKLELGLEGHRYWDLQRWGDIPSELIRIYDYEKTMEWGPAAYVGASIGPEDANFPVPQRQIDLSNGNLVQNR